MAGYPARFLRLPARIANARRDGLYRLTIRLVGEHDTLDSKPSTSRP